MRSVFRSYRVVSTAVAATAFLFLSTRAPGQILNESQKLTASDAAEFDHFGSSVSISGDTAVVGADGDDDGGSLSGSAYVFQEVSGTWTQIAKLTASDAAEFDQFGSRVSISGDTAVVGASGDDDGGDSSGSAYVFREVAGVWTQIAKLTASDAAANDQFGFSVSISSDTAIVGAERDDDGGSDSGSAYVFREVSGTWTQIAKLTASDAASVDFFGNSVSISGDTAIVAAVGDDNDDGGNLSGSAYVFQEVSGTWTQIAKLTASDAAAHDQFGYSVSLSGDTAVVGANRDDDGGSDSGSAYVFSWNGSAWIEEQKLLASDGAVGDFFGISVSLSGDTAIVGANLDDDGGDSSGSAYVFREVSGTWTQIAKVTAADAASVDFFGGRVSLSGDTAVVAAPSDDDAGDHSGSAYVFDLTCGNGLLEGSEECDDGDVADGDGCSSTCTVESGYTCDAGEPSVCTDINECVMGTHNCDDNAACTNTPGSFACVLLPPATGDDVCSGGSNDGGSCSTDADCPGGVCGLKSRYVSITPPETVATSSVGVPDHRQDAGATRIGATPVSSTQVGATHGAVAGGDPLSIRVTLLDIDDALGQDGVEGQVWWAGASQTIDNTPNANLTGAQLLCEASPSNAEVWPAGVLHLFGAPIVPGSTYEVRMCDAAGANCSDPLTVATGKWGDIVADFGGPNQPNFGDITAVVDKFKSLASAPDMTRTDLLSSSGEAVDGQANFADISADVDAFKGSIYPYIIPACP